MPPDIIQITSEYIQSICTRLFQSSTTQSQPPPEPPETPQPAAVSQLIHIAIVPPC